MPTLIACLSSGKGTWTEVMKIVQSQPWTKIFLITDKFGQEKFIKQDNIDFVLIDTFKEVPELTKQIKEQLKVSDFEVGLSLISGSGKEHIATLEAVLELGLNFRLITLVNNEVKTLGLEIE